MFDSYASQGFMYQIIFLDLVMPRMGGYDAALQIRMKERKNLFPKTFICAISGDRDCYSKVAKFEIDEVGKKYLALKPLDIAKVEAIVRHAKMAAEANN
jgi:CheY-like chemotaxis protein